ncbi:hypothetical protein [Nocardioides convexus]|uniref:hypothetical protein n=1 Tax=Nocardioides convexus TaxID=2712224 RepID=UPI00241879AB|nr:hypothetical protein [Nocardioides convexus]
MNQDAIPEGISPDARETWPHPEPDPVLARRCRRGLRACVPARRWLSSTTRRPRRPRGAFATCSAASPRASP